MARCRLADNLSGVEAVTGNQLLADLKLTSGATYITPWDEALKHQGLPPRSVVEIRGGTSSGKSTLLTHFILTRILEGSFILQPSAGQRLTIETGGHAKGVILIDCDNRFSWKWLRALMRRHLIKSAEIQSNDPGAVSSQANTDAIDGAVARSLGRLHVFAPTSAIAFSATLMNLPAFHAECMPDEELAMVCIDNIRAFTEKKGGQSGALPLATVVQQALQSIQRRSSCLVLITSSSDSDRSLNKAVSSQHSSSFEVLLTPYRNPVIPSRTSLQSLLSNLEPSYTIDSGKCNAEFRMLNIIATPKNNATSALRFESDLETFFWFRSTKETIEHE